jgi:hypothetical protein
MTERQRKPKPLTRAQIKEGLNTVPMDTLILGTNTEAKLTPKQREFARLVALGESKAGAYRQSYKSKGNSKTQAANGYKLSQNTAIQQTTEAFIAAQRFAESHTPAQLRAFVIQQLAKHAADEDAPLPTRVRCLELIGKHSGVDSFVNRSEVVHIKASGDIRDRIAEKLKLIGAGTTIEHNAQQDDEQDAESLLAELDPTPFDAQDADPTAPTTPRNEGVFGAELTHIIPHTQSLTISDQHTQSSLNPDDQTFPGEYADLHEVTDTELVYGSLSTADEEPSVGMDPGLDGRNDPGLAGKSVDNGESVL